MPYSDIPTFYTYTFLNSFYTGLPLFPYDKSVEPGRQYSVDEPPLLQLITRCTADVGTAVQIAIKRTEEEGTEVEEWVHLITLQGLFGKGVGSGVLLGTTGLFTNVGRPAVTGTQANWYF